MEVVIWKLIINSGPQVSDTLFFKILLMFAYFGERRRERDKAREGKGRKRGTRLRAVSTDQDAGLKLTN